MALEKRKMNKKNEKKGKPFTPFSKEKKTKRTFGKPKRTFDKSKREQIKVKPQVAKDVIKTPNPAPLDKGEGDFKKVVRHIKVDAEGENVRLDKYMQQVCPGLPFGRIQNLIRKKQIKVNGKRAEMNQRLALGDIIRIPPVENVRPGRSENEAQKTYRTDLKKNVIFKDENIIALNKPAGLAAQGGSKIKDSVAGGLENLKFESTITPMLTHRLDRETSGVLILARTHRAARELGELFKSGKLEKIYIAEVEGKVEQSEGKIDAPLSKEFERVVVDYKGQKALSTYKVIVHEPETTLVELSPKTGRTHQLRVHMAYIGHPILGDEKYNPKNAKKVKRLHLHAFEIRFKLLGKAYDIKAPLPSEMKGKYVK